MKHPVKTLATLAFLGAMAPSVHAVSIKDDVLSLTPGIRIQTRAQMNDATGPTGDEYRVQGGDDDEVNDPLDFSIRRARIYLSFKYGSNWKGQLAINADNVDRDADGASRGVVIRYAWLERAFKMEGDMTHAIHFGLDKPYNNPSDAAMSSSRTLLPNSNAASGMLDPRGVGVGYRFNHPVFALAADVQNNMNGPKDATGDNAQEEEGFFYGVRAEFSFSPEWFIAKRSESFLGKEGHGLTFGLSYGTNQDAVVDDVGDGSEGQVSDTAYGIDVMFWMNGLSAYAEYRAMTTEGDSNVNGSLDDVESEVIVLQVGYAIPMADGILEPAIRFQMIDENTDADEDSEFGNNSETGGSGTQIDLGLNYYLSGHDNKLQLAVSLWEAEEGEGDATIIRLQHQINF